MLGFIRNTARNFKNLFFKDRRVALIKLEGIIFDSKAYPMSSKLIESLDCVKKQGIKSVVIRINSPGGTVGASQEIYYAIKKLQEDNIKVVASFADVAASGGLYVGVACDKIVSVPGCITGSIGVIVKNRIIKDLYQKIGIEHDTIKTGAYKDILSNTKHFTDDEREILQSMVNDTFSQFIDAVASGRNIETEKVKSFADGRIFTGHQAKELGLVDEIGTQYDAVKIAASLAGITGEPKIVDMSPKKSFLQKITGANMESLLENIGVSSVYSGIPLWLMPRI